jgi:hypothetical protein
MTTIKDVADGLQTSGATGCFIGFMRDGEPSLVTKGGINDHVRILAAYVEWVANNYPLTKEDVAAALYGKLLKQLGVGLPTATILFEEPFNDHTP